MRQNNEKKTCINMENPSVEAIHELLTGTNIFELYFSGNTEKERLQEVKELYRIVKKEHDRISPDILARKTYLLKTSTTTALAEKAKKEGTTDGKCIVKIMQEYISNVEKGQIVLEPATYDDGAEYSKKSYRLPGAVALKFQAICDSNDMAAYRILQALIDKYVNEKRK